MPYCKKCKRDTQADAFLTEFCSKCAAKYESTVVMAKDTLLPAPAPAQARIICVGHGTYDQRDGWFIVPRNVTIRFRSPHTLPTPGGNDERIIEAEDRGFGQKCYNYRLWAMTGAEAFTLPATHTRDATQFRSGGFHSPLGQKTWLYVSDVKGSARLADLVYGLGGAASRGTGYTWEVLWLARRIVEPKEATLKTQSTHPKGTIDLV